MSSSPHAEIAELERLPMDELKQRWRELIGTDPPGYNRSFLISRLTYRLHELAHGGLSQSASAKMEALLAEAGSDKLGRIRRRRWRAGSCRRWTPGGRERRRRAWSPMM